MPSVKTRANLLSVGWNPCPRQTECTFSILVQRTTLSSCCVKQAQLWRSRSSSPGASTQRATARLRWCRRTRTSASARTLMNFFIRAGALWWRPPGSRTRPARLTATPGTSTPTAPRALSFGSTTCMSAEATAGHIRSMRCWSARTACTPIRYT